jgi:Uma2 family endonuclease
MMHVQALEPARWGGKGLPGQDELPCEDGEPMETGFHDAQDALLKDTLLDAWSDRKDFFVAGNMFVYFSVRSAATISGDRTCSWCSTSRPRAARAGSLGKRAGACPTWSSK